MDGILLADKPKQWTSFDVVAKVRGLLGAVSHGKKVKVGHSGTLDPMATGLLLLLVGRATKRAKEFSRLDKTYQSCFKLGVVSDTDDREGQVKSFSDKRPDASAVKQALESFLGNISQIPPSYSAVKIKGRRAYHLARAGKPVKLRPRSVKIYEISQINYDYPYLSFTAKVSSGTYIRAWARDLGAKLGTGAILYDLRRTQIGQFSVSEAIPVKRLNKNNIKDYIIQA